MPRRKIPETVGAAELGAHLGITSRQVSALAGRRVLPRDGRGAYPFNAASQAYLEHCLAEIRRRAGSRSDDELRDQRRAEIAARMRREDRNLIMLREAVAVFDRMAAALLDSIDRLPSAIGSGQKQIEEARGRLASDFAEIRRQLVSGEMDADLPIPPPAFSQQFIEDR